ncbi:MAG: aldehyde ferredoxin oxidoreductase family protein [Candidatus Bathyarchaeia archaeon]
MVKGGYTGKILRIDLTSGNIKNEPLPSDDIMRKYVGCWGLGLWYLTRELPPGVGPVEPENPMVIMNGPLVGTVAPSPNNATIATLNADTTFTAGRSHSHGWWAPNLKFAGYDGIIITGASDKPVYLWIHDGQTEIKDASKIWGRDSHDTEDLVKQDVGVKDASVAAIGPAGEHVCAGASIQNDKNHGFSHSGVGTVMGSKKLKAIAVHGTGNFPQVNPDALKEVSRVWTASASKEGLYPIIGRAGVPRSDYQGVLQLVGVSSKNWLSNILEGYGVGMSKHKITPKPCYRCPVACSYDVEITSGPHKGYVATPSGGGENTEGSASIVGVSESGTVFYLTDLNDRLGFESSTAGCSMAVAFEAYEKGMLTKEDTDGLELKWGDAEVVEKLLNKVAHREGFGDVLADGPKRAGERVGLPNAGVHIKGSGMNLHDWRRAWGVLLGQIVSGGSGWPAPGADCWTPEADVGYPVKKSPMTYKGKADEVAKTGNIKFWNDCIGCCWFATWGLPGVLKYTTSAVSAATGWDFTPEEAIAVGERVTALERIFNMSRGMTAEDDINVSPRIAEPSPDGPAKGKTIQPYIEGWVRDFYKLMGWDEKTGKPLRSTIKRLGLEEFEKLVWP